MSCGRLLGRQAPSGCATQALCGGLHANYLRAKLHAGAARLPVTLMMFTLGQHAAWPQLPCSNHRAARALPALQRRPPSIVSVLSTVADAGTACLTQPTSGGPYTGFNCTVCRGSDCTQAPTCSNNRRRSLLAGACGAGEKACQLPNLESTTVFK